MTTTHTRFTGIVQRTCQVLDRLGGSQKCAVTVCGIAAFLLLGCQLLRHYAFETPAYDLRIHEELVANTLQGKLLYSDLLGGSFLSHHVSLIFALFAPFYALWPSPVWLLVLQGIFVGCAGWFLWNVSRNLDLRPMLCLALLCTFFMFNGLHSGYFRGFQQEVLGLCFAIGFLWAVQRRHPIAATVLGMLTILCREDFALFLLGMGGMFLCQRDRRRYGLVTVLVSAVWLIAAYGIIIPAHLPAGYMAGAERWAQYGSHPTEIASNWIRHPLPVLHAIANQGASSHLRRLLLLPLADPMTVLTIGAPWIIYTTSSFDQQASLDGAYASMFVAFLFIGMVRVLSRERARMLASHDTVALFFCALLLVLNVPTCPFPKSIAGLSAAHAALTQLTGEASAKRFLAQSCIIPHLAWPLDCDMLGSPRATAESDYDIILMSLDKDPWPLDKPSLARLVDELSQSSAWARETHGCLLVFRRKGDATSKEGAPKASEVTARKLAEPQR